MANLFKNFVSNLTNSVKQNPLSLLTPKKTVAGSFMNSLATTPVPSKPQSSPIVPANNSATSTIKATITPSKAPSSLPPAGQQYAQSLAQPVQMGNGIRTPYDPASETPLQNDPSTGRKNTTPQSDPFDEYIKSLNGNTSEALNKFTAANERLAGIQSTSERKSLDARRGYEAMLDKSGGLKAGAQQEATQLDRRNNSELADLAIQESAAARSASVAQDAYTNAINAGKSAYEAQQASRKAQADAENETYKRTQDTLSNELATKKFDEDKRQYGLDYALKQKELAISQQKANTDTAKVNADIGASSATSNVKQQEALSTISIVNNLLNNKNLAGISGPLDAAKPGLIMSSEARLAKNQFNQIKGLLSLENRSKLKGQGAVSDFEGKTLDRAASALNRNLSDAEFEKQLKQVRGTIQTSHGLPATVLLVDPRTGASQVVQSDSAGIAQAVRDGVLVEYQ